MTSVDTTHTETAGGVQPPAACRQMVKVWDPFVRVFHWSLVILFATAFLTGDESERFHLFAGYAIAALVALRIVWGFIGTRYARFANFVKGPVAVAGFMRDTLRLKAPRYLGHNPAGGAMILALLAMLIGLSVSGYLMTLDQYWGSQALEDVHEALAYITLVLVALHVAGVVMAGIEHGENLVASMITGRKRAE
jgi:cytochrome b